MKRYAPSYYPRFSCLADKCRHSCCIGWEIDVDKESLARYDALPSGYADKVKNSIDFSGEVPHFRLEKGERCPHLNEKGLCRIILEWGEDALCHICKEHPRFYHETTRGTEVGLGMACEEACRLILTSDGYQEFVEAGDDGEEAEKPFFDALPHREQAYGTLSDRTIPYAERLDLLAESVGLSPSEIPDSDWRRMLSSIEYLNESHRDVFSLYTSFPERAQADEVILERALAYFLFRHTTPAESEDEFAVSLGFCLFCERLLASLLACRKEKTLEAAIDLARILSEEIEYSEDNTAFLRDPFFDLLA